VGRVADGLGAHYAATGRTDQAETANEPAIAIRRRLVEDQPDIQTLLGGIQFDRGLESGVESCSRIAGSLA
jgi:hypothetical protein